MFGRDHFIISKPQQVKPIAKQFMENIKDASDKDRYTKKENVPIIEFHEKKVEPETKTLPKPKLKNTNNISVPSLNKEYINSIKPEAIKPTANSFLNKVKSNYHPDKLLFSYSDTKGKLGTLEPTGKNIKVIIRKNKRKEYIEDIIEVYLKNTDVKPDGLSLQTKGYGNTKELCIANALKKAVIKLNPVTTNISERVFLNYSLSTVSILSDGGFECKVKVTPGKV